MNTHHGTLAAQSRVNGILVSLYRHFYYCSYKALSCFRSEHQLLRKKKRSLIIRNVFIICALIFLLISHNEF